jgi:hypothetical protein
VIKPTLKHCLNSDSTDCSASQIQKEWHFWDSNFRPSRGKLTINQNNWFPLSHASTLDTTALFRFKLVWKILPSHIYKGSAPSGKNCWACRVCNWLIWNNWSTISYSNLTSLVRTIYKEVKGNLITMNGHRENWAIIKGWDAVEAASVFTRSPNPLSTRAQAIAAQHVADLESASVHLCY